MQEIIERKIRQTRPKTFMYRYPTLFTTLMTICGSGIVLSPLLFTFFFPEETVMNVKNKVDPIFPKN